MKTLHASRWALALVVPFLLAMHDGGCAANSSSKEVPPDTIDGCTLVFHKTANVNSEGSRWTKDLTYWFNDSDGKVHATGSGGSQFTSVSYSYSSGTIFVDWGRGATETIELTSHTEFEYTGDDGSGGPTVQVKGTYEPKGTCEALQ